MRKLTTMDTIWYNVVLLASSHGTSRISYEAVSIASTDAIRLSSANVLV